MDTQLETKKLVLEIADEELKHKNAFLELLDVVKQMLRSYLPLQPDIEEFANTVERGENITAGNSFRSFLSTRTVFSKALLNDLTEMRLGMKINSRYDKIYCKSR